MSGTVGLLVGLLVLSYLGSVLVGKRTTHGLGLPSGAEYILLGFVLGPVLLGIVQRPVVDAFRPMIGVGAAWLALIVGLGYEHPARPYWTRQAALGAVLTALVSAGVGCTVWFTLDAFATLPTFERQVLSVGAGIVCCVTTRPASPWLSASLSTESTVLWGLSALARLSALVPALALALLCSLAPGHGLDAVPWFARAGITLGIGVLLGVIATLLLGREFRRDESWGLLLGTALFGAGVTVRLGFSSVATMFAMGVTMTLLSRHRSEIRAMIAPTGKAVLLPVALLAGASVQPSAGALPMVLGAALGARLLAELLRGALAWLLVRDVRPAGPFVGLSMLTTGGFTLAAAVELHARLEVHGATLLALAAAGAVLGELLGPLFLQKTLALKKTPTQPEAKAETHDHETPDQEPENAG